MIILNKIINWLNIWQKRPEEYSEQEMICINGIDIEWES